MPLLMITDCIFSKPIFTPFIFSISFNTEDKLHFSIDFFHIGRTYLLQQGITREEGTIALSDNAGLGNGNNFFTMGSRKVHCLSVLIVNVSSDRNIYFHLCILEVFLQKKLSAK